MQSPSTLVRPFCIAALAALAVLLSSAAVPPSPAAAQPKVDCDNAMSTFEMNECAGRDFATADAELNRVYKEALQAIPEMAVDEPRFSAKSWEAALRASQRAWVAFRDAECDDHVPMFWTGGTATTAEVIGCKTELTQARTKALKARYEIE